MNIDSVHKKEHGFFDDIGVLVVDEAHLSLSPGRIRSYQHFYPKYLICLTATPFERSDKIDEEAFNLYLGKKSRVFRSLYREHFVYKYDTGIKGKVKLNKMGNLDWNDMIEKQCHNEQRNDLIVKVLCFFKDINFIVLCKRVHQAKYLYEKLLELGENVDKYTGENKYFNFNSRILISSFQKSGVGFSWLPCDKEGIPLDMGLLVASDVSAYFAQYLGRCMRSDKSPIVIDFVDDFSTFHKHWMTRREVYERTGGIIKNFKKEFPSID